MGSTAISGIESMLGQGAVSGISTGSKEDDLKIHFVEVLSQMTTQVGQESFSQNEKQQSEKGTVTNDMSSKDDYNAYRYRESNVKGQSEKGNALEDMQVNEKVAAYSEDVKAVLKETLGVTDEEIEAVMESLGITVMDLMNPGQLAALTAGLTGCQDIAELLCNDNFVQVLKEVGMITEELLGELGITREELTQLFTSMQNIPQNTVAEGQQFSEILNQEQTQTQEQTQEQTQTVASLETVDGENNVTSDETETAENSLEYETVKTAEKLPEMKENGSQTTTDAMQNGQTSEETKTAQQTVVVENQETKDLNTAEQKMSEKSGSIVEEEQLTEDTSVKQQNSNSDDGQKNNGSQGQQQINEAVSLGQNVSEVSSMETTAPVLEFARQLDVESIIKQIAEFTKITISNAETTMEMQLNPEHLGKIYLEVTTKEGAVSAHIMAQNEVVKEALESQLAELKQNLNQVGIKVDAVEVTVGSHEFERNLEQNSKQEEKQAEQQEEAAGKMRRINLNSLDELSGVMTEEESLVAQIMADRGNSIDFTA